MFADAVSGSEQGQRSQRQGGEATQYDAIHSAHSKHCFSRIIIFRILYTAHFTKQGCKTNSSGVMKIFESVYGFENPNQPTQPLVLSFRWRPTWLSFTLALGRQEPAHLACNTAEIPTDRQSYCVLAWNAVNSIFDASTEEAVWSTACDSHAQRENDTGLVWKNKIQWRLRRWEWTELTELEFVGRGGGVSGWALCVCVCVSVPMPGRWRTAEPSTQTPQQESSCVSA